MKNEALFAGDPGFVYLDDEERELIEDIENAEWLPLEGEALAVQRVKLAEAAKTSIAEIAVKTERMNIRMTKGDMSALKATARLEGLPYQSLVTSILHKYITGRLVDINEVSKVLKQA